jgi:hypothetical protein
MNISSLFSLLHTAIDSKGEGEGPVYNYRPFVAPFFIAFIIVIIICFTLNDLNEFFLLRSLLSLW